MRKFGLIGYPLGHSFSRKYFTDKFVREHISDCQYDNFPIPEISQITGILADKEVCGLNVTIPYKTSVIKYLDKLDPEAAEAGAVNVIKIKRHIGKIETKGFNSDITGIRDTILPVISPVIKNALVLGTGGSSRAVCHVLKELGISFVMVSRDKKPGVITYPEISETIIKSSLLIVNTTPLGMYPDISGKPDITYDLLSADHILFDLVYNPEVTEFLRKGQERGCKLLSGLKMLYSQAERSWQIWNSDES